MSQAEDHAHTAAGDMQLRRAPLSELEKVSRCQECGNVMVEFPGQICERCVNKIEDAAGPAPDIIRVEDTEPSDTDGDVREI